MKKEQFFPPVFDRIASWQNLYQASVAARKGTRPSRDSMEYFLNLEKELTRLEDNLLNGSWQPGDYRYFDVFEPKKRQIAVAPFRDRVVHHAIVDVLTPYYERTFYEYSYACRKGKGTHRAIRYAQNSIVKYDWYLKMDIHKFFDSIDHQQLLQIIQRKWNDVPLIEVLTKIFDKGGTHGKGLPIGNLTSQFFANVYLNELDNFVKRSLKVPDYVRYMDDFVIFSNDKAVLKDWKNRIQSYLRDHLSLQINPASIFLNHKVHGLGFCGARIFPSLIRVRKPTLQRMINKIKQREWEYENGYIDQQVLNASIESLMGHLAAFNSKKLAISFIRQHLRAWS